MLEYIKKENENKKKILEDIKIPDSSLCRIAIFWFSFCKNRHPSPICTRFEHHFHVLKPHLHRRSFSDTLPENQRHLIALKHVY